MFAARCGPGLAGNCLPTVYAADTNCTSQHVRTVRDTQRQPLATVTWTGEMISLYSVYSYTYVRVTVRAVERIFSLPTMELELDLGELDLTSENAEFDFDDFDGKLGALPPCCVLRALCAKTLVKTILSSFYFPLIHGCLHSCVHALLHAHLTHANTAWYSTSVARSPSV